jgi:hypothetical protein
MAATVNNIRLQKRYLQTPVRVYRNDAGRRVWLVGLVHHGQRSYYRALKDLVLALQEDGTAVHYEDTAMTEQDLAAADVTDAERAAIRSTAPAASQLDLYEPWGWVEQLDGFGGGAPAVGVRRSWPPGWERHDLREVDIIRLRGVEQNSAEPRTSDVPPPARRPSKLARRVRLAQIAVEFWTLASGVRAPKPTDAVILDRRNDVAIEASDAVPGDVVLLWGCTHLDGLQTRLQARGYTLAEQSWHTVGRLPRATSILFWSVVGLLANLRRLPLLVKAARAEHERNRPYRAAMREELAKKD